MCRKDHAPFVTRILIVDDDSITSELIEFMMKNSATNCEIVSVLTPTEGLSLAAVQHFDLNVLDYRLASMSGPEVCRALRQMSVEAPIMFFTGEASHGERAEAMRAGADAIWLSRMTLGN